MPSPYQYKKKQITGNYIVKVYKKLEKEIEDIRNLALETYKYFKQKVDEDTRDDASKKEMVNSLKLTQGLAMDRMKILEACAKVEKSLGVGSTKGREKGKIDPDVDLGYNTLVKFVNDEYDEEL